MHAKTLCPVTVGRLNSLQGGGSGSMDQFPANFKVRLHWLVMARKREHFCTEMALVLLILSIGYSGIKLPQYPVKEKLYDRFRSNSW